MGGFGKYLCSSELASPCQLPQKETPEQHDQICVLSRLCFLLIPLCSPLACDVCCLVRAGHQWAALSSAAVTLGCCFSFSEVLSQLSTHSRALPLVFTSFCCRAALSSLRLRVFCCLSDLRQLLPVCRVVVLLCYSLGKASYV